MRDAVYGKPISDKEWENCKHYWMTPKETKWLTDQCYQQGLKQQRQPSLTGNS